MKPRITQPASLHALALAAILAACFAPVSCKPKETPTPSAENKPSGPKIPQAQRLAEEVIANDPNVELVEVVGDKMRIRNKYTKRSLTLPFQMIIDDQYPMIQEDEATAKRILAIREANAKKKAPTHLTMQTGGWGNTPEWIPRYPGLDLAPTRIHTPREDGSVWGNITGTHSDSVEKMTETLASEFEKSGLALTRRMAEKNAVYMIFETLPDDQDEAVEKRKVSCTLSRHGEKTRLSIQYTYGTE